MTRILCGLLLAMILDGCTLGGPACQAGFVRPCACAMGTGTQTCNAAGTDFSACDCPVPVSRVDLLIEIDNSSGMVQNHSLFLAQIGPLMQAISPPATSVHVGVVSSDLGTPGSQLPGCADSEHGDDGLLNPIRNGAAMMQHEPWTGAPASYGRPSDCTDPNEFPAFLVFDSTSGQTIASFTHDVQCNAGLFTGGCGLESQLESVYRALVIHDATDAASNTDPNAGFLEDDAVLAILILSDEEDGSVRNSAYQHGSPGSDARDVYDPASTAWSDPNLNLRFYMYQPGTSQDPTWTLDRYLDPHDATVGLLGLKPGHPERVVFGAITGVPLPNDGAGSAWQNADGSTQWDMLLGAAGGSADDFVNRDSSRAIDTMSREGPVSMRQANADPACAERTVPACRREGSTYSPTGCTTTQQYFAWPARRIVELARRFDQAPLCGGHACSNGMVASICASDYSAAIHAFATRIVAHLQSQR